MMKRVHTMSMTFISLAVFLSSVLSAQVQTPLFVHQKMRSETETILSRQKGMDFSDQFDRIWKLVKTRFYNSGMNGVDWVKIGETYRARLSQVQTMEAFQYLINQMLAELHTSHTSYYTSDDLEFYMLPSVLQGDLQGHQVEHIGIMGRQIGKEYLVAATMEGGPAEKAGILSGDRLLSADGKPFTSAGSFRGKDGQSVKIELHREGETGIKTVHVVPVKQNILRAFLNATEKSVRTISAGNRKIGYIHLWTMSNDAFRSALEQIVMNRLHNTDGLILDLRDGYGGTPFGYGDVFFRPDISLEQQSQGNTPYVRHLGYAKPMVVLINRGTRSAKEFFSYQFKAGHRAKLVGTRTAGAFLGATAYEVGKDGLLELAVLGLKVDGKLLEDIGVAPDVNIPAQQTYTEKDNQMLAAQQILLEAIRSNSTGASPVAP